MSDMANQFYNAWIGVMGGHPSRLLCTWYVDRAWQTELRSKVKDPIVAAEIYKMLRIVLQQAELHLFQDYLAKLNKMLPNLSIEFCKYFQQEWVNKAELWAYCYRKGLRISTNMSVEAFHGVFKHGYLKGKGNKRVDNCLHGLLKYIRDKSIDRITKLTKGQATHKLKLIQDRHTSSKTLTVDLVQEDSTSNSRWFVSSCNANKISYTLLKQADKCLNNACQLKCSECNICIHGYICNCPDALIHNTICKHIHLLQRYLAKNSLDAAEIFNIEEIMQESDYKSCEVKLVSSELNKDVKSPSDVTSIWNKLQEKLRPSAKELDNCADKDSLAHISSKINASYYLYKSLQKHGTLSPITPVTNSPSNKKVDQQIDSGPPRKKEREQAMLDLPDLLRKILSLCLLYVVYK